MATVSSAALAFAAVSWLRQNICSRLYRLDARLTSPPQRALSHRRQGSNWAHIHLSGGPLAPRQSGCLRAASWSLGISDRLRSVLPGSIAWSALLCRRRLYGAPMGLYIHISRNDGRRAFLQLRGRNRRGFVDADHRRAIFFI